MSPRPPAPPPPFPSPRAREIIRHAATGLISGSDAVFASIDEAVLATQPRAILADPELTEAIRASNRSNLTHWAASNLSLPGAPVGVNRSEETRALARLIARRGIEDTSRVSYNAGQNAAWMLWMEAVFAATRDPAELREVLEVSARSVFAFVETMLALLREEIERERGEVFSAANARRLAAVGQLLGGSTAGSLINELRYRVDTFTQTSVVLSMREGTERLLELVERAGVELAPRLRGRPLAVVADASTVWAWFPSGSGEPIDAMLAEHFSSAGLDRARIAVGPSRPGWDGFRGHADAVAALEVANAPVVTFNEVIIATLVRHEPERVRQFVLQRTRGLDAEVRETLRAYLANRCSPTRTAAATYTHRNTVIDRIRRAERRLRIPIEGHELELALALELDRYSWLPERQFPPRPPKPRIVKV